MYWLYLYFTQASFFTCASDSFLKVVEKICFCVSIYIVQKFDAHIETLICMQNSSNGCHMASYTARQHEHFLSVQT